PQLRADEADTLDEHLPNKRKHSHRKLIITTRGIAILFMEVEVLNDNTSGDNITDGSGVRDTIMLHAATSQ
ncbi:MAG: hypothetical protein ALECFALPRED_010510, partial [Alectoria fallacina]